MDDHLDTGVTRASPNKDPITGAPGAHPVGVGVGAATGGIAAGAAAGTLAAGPLGTAIGAAVGVVVGGLAGKAVAEHYDPTIEEQYWRGAYADEPYYQRGKTFDDYAPAYRLGGEAYGRHGGTSFENFEDELADEYSRSHGTSRLSWDEARPATFAAWHRLRGDVV